MSHVFHRQLRHTYPTAVRGDGPYLYDSTGLHIFHDLLPAKFQKQLRSAIPYLISNQDDET